MLIFLPSCCFGCGKVGVVTVGKGVPQREVYEEALLSHQTPALDVKLWRQQVWAGELWDYLLPSGLEACCNCRL